MSKELELAAAGSVGGLAKARRRPAPAHTHSHCLNCGAHLHGRYCQDCGQSADDHHRSIFHLLWEAVEGLTHLDGRLARTLPPLFFRPGRLARDHIEGRRTRHVPPFRLFLISLFLFMLALETASHHGQNFVHVHTTRTGSAPTGTAAPGSGAPKAARRLVEITRTNAPQTEVSPAAGLDAFAQSTKQHSPVGRWMIEHGRRALANQEYFRSITFEWAHRLAIMMLPIFALLLTGLYVYKRQFYVYDHLVVSMQFLSFVFLLWAVVYVLPYPLRAVVLIAATIWTPVNLFMTLRGAYGSSVIGAGVKALVLWVSTLVLFLVLLLAILAVALNQL